MKKLIFIVMLLIGCSDDGVQKLGTKTTYDLIYTEYCIDGVKYIKTGQGMTVKFDRLSKVEHCNIRK